MPEFGEFVEYLEGQIAALEPGDYDIVEIMRARWDEVGTDGQKRDFGTNFRKWIGVGRLGLKFKDINPNGRHNRFTKA